MPEPAAPALPVPPAECAPCPAYPSCLEARPCPCEKWGSSRILNGHRFIFPSFVETAFVSTYLGARVGAASLQLPNLPFGRLGNVNIEALRIAEGIDFGLRLFDGVGIFATFAGFADASTNARSVVIRTGQYELDANGGAIVKLINGKKNLLSLRARVAGSRGATFTLLPLLRSLSQTPLATVEDVVTGNLDELLVVPFTRFDWGGSLAYAHAFSPTLSLQASAGVTFGKATLQIYDPFLKARQDFDFSTFTPAAAVALTVDARTVHVPLALMLEYLFSRPQTTNKQTDKKQSLSQNTMAAGIFYSGRPDLQTGVLAFAELGLEPVTGFTTAGAPADSGKPRIFGGTLSLRYIW